MADHSYTFADLENRVRYAVGNPGSLTLATGVTCIAIVNDALVTLWHRRRWRFRQASENLSLTISQSYIALSATYGRTLSLAGYPGTNYRVRMVDVNQLNQLRQQTGISGFDLFCAVSWTAQASGTTAPIARLEIFPTPAATVSNVLTHIYERRVPAGTTGSTSVPDIPPQFLPALDKLAQGLGQMQVLHEDKGGFLAQHEMMLKGLILEDAMSQPHGPPVAGTVEMLGESTPTDARFEPTAASVA